MKKKNHPRLPKSSATRLNDLESHLHFLWDGLRLYPEQHHRYKQIAAELRVLVCKKGRNKPLLLDLMDKYDFSYEVQPVGCNNSAEPQLVARADLAVR